MATMVKEKRREKKKSKIKSDPRNSVEREQPPLVEPRGLDDTATTSEVLEANVSTTRSEDPLQNPEETVEHNADVLELQTQFDYDIQSRLENSQAYLKLNEETRGPERSQEGIGSQTQEMVTDAIPSAPVFEEEDTAEYVQHPQHIVEEYQKPKLQSMTLEEAVKLYGGTEMERVKASSEKEEAIVEAGPLSGPEHPLVDLLSTFRSSLIAIDRERIQLSKGYSDEEKYRKSLWRVETRWAEGSEECPHGSKVTACVKYEHAEFLKEKLPVAKLKLEGLLREVQDSYCHHQHTALLTHCQIEDLIAETTRSNKKEIREALALVLRALRLSDNAPLALAGALQRWATVLSASLLDARDTSQLLHLLHHLFRQTRSVRWAARVIRSYIRAGDRVEAAQTVALLDLLLARPGLESAVECTEDADDAWEEMDKTGSGAVSDGCLRERDILALLRSFPLRDLVARIVLLPHSDITKAREYEWGDRSGGSGVLKACCGARALLDTLQRGVTSHPTYTKLHAQLRGLAVQMLHALAGLHLHSRYTIGYPTYTKLHAQLRSLAVQMLHALAGLHLHSRDYYSRDLEERITAELEACFCAGVLLLGERLQELPATLLTDHAAREYCVANITALHDKTPKQLDFLPVSLPVTSCGSRVRTVTQIALDRLYDHELARTVMEFLFQTGIKRKPVPCKGSCESTSRELLPRLLDAHAYLHTLALHTLAEYYQVDALDPSSIDPLAPHKWRPTPGEVKQLLEDWSTRCPQLIQHLLMKMDYTPHSGVGLDTQLTIGSWVCHWLRADPRRAPPPGWAWLVLRRMQLHRTSWRGGGDAPPPDPTPDDLFSMAFAVLSSSWGHCIPLICSEGVDALCKLAATRPTDAAHCLAPVMLIMAHSPESVSFTPKFTELFNLLLAAGPTMVQRALGLGPEPGTDVLLRYILNQIQGNCPGISRASLTSAWLHALWKPALPASTLLDTLLLATRHWATFDAHVNHLLQDKNASEIVTTAVRNVSTASMLCLCVLRGLLAVQSSTRVLPNVCQVLHFQRTCGDRIHVDNALKHIGANMSAEDLVIYKCATALLSSPPQRPSNLMLWALFIHLYLQRPPDSMTDTTSPCGPLFFSGIIKSRVLGQIRKKLQETITYHQNQLETLKQNNQEERPRPPARSKVKKEGDDGVLPMLNIRDLSGESSDSSESDSENSTESDREETSDVVDVKEELALLLKYHTSAESMCKEFLRWLDEGNQTRAMPHHADIARFIPEQVLDAAWSRELASRRPPPQNEVSSPPATPTTPRATPFQSTITRILNIKDCSRKRSRRLSIKSPLEDIDCKDPRTLLELVDNHLANIEALAEEWCNEVARLASLDSALWELVAQLRVRKALPPVRKSCAHAHCKPRTIHLQEYEWCISLGAETGIDKNRQTARSLTRRLARPRPHAARSAAALLTIARHVGSFARGGARVVERAWQCARSVYTCAPAQTALTSLVELLADVSSYPRLESVYLFHRHVASCEVAVRVVERAWQCARSVHTCAPAQTALTSLVELLADTCKQLRVVERAWQCARSVCTCVPAQTALTTLVELLADVSSYPLLESVYLSATQTRSQLRGGGARGGARDPCTAS
ncbi:hypothetical protein NE865_12872 [Phthorimaea operculella]|nr:hypothetical protein NE865_12872 [Phthorimaea operculella]